MLKALVQSIPSVEGLEAIVVDDHSSEDLSQISLEKFDYHKFIRNKPDKRYAGAARNAGLEQASGEYVFFADSDDLIVSDGFLKCLELLGRDKPDILFCYATSFKHSDGSRGTRHIRNNWLVKSVQKGASNKVLARSGGPIAKFIRKEFLDVHAIRFEPQRYSNDIVFSASLMVHNPVVQVTNEVVYSVRESNDSLVSDFSLESSLIRLEALSRYNTLLNENGLGYLRVPALVLLSRIYGKDRRQAVSQARRTKKIGHPVFFTWWTYKNIFLRWLSYKE